MVVLYDKNGEIVGDVKYNNDLDYWDGHNYTNGGTGRHLGFGRLESGEFYLIYGTQWQGEQDSAVIVSARKIVKEAIKSNSVSKLKWHSELVEIYENEFNKKTIEEKSKVFSIRVNLRESEEETRKKISEMTQKITNYKELENNEHIENPKT